MDWKNNPMLMYRCNVYCTYSTSINKITMIMKKIEVTMQEIWQATKPVIYKNKKKYTRKTKHNERI